MNPGPYTLSSEPETLKCYTLNPEYVQPHQCRSDSFEVKAPSRQPASHLPHDAENA